MTTTSFRFSLTRSTSATIHPSGASDQLRLHIEDHAVLTAFLGIVRSRDEDGLLNERIFASNPVFGIACPIIVHSETIQALEYILARI